ncbi:MAG TPA: MmcQ/YjbR family DNA-binding protein [Acidimicrobiales bacterium]
MADRDDVRRIALALPGAVEVDGRFAFAVEDRGKSKEFVWVWMERVDPKKARVPNDAVIAVRVANAAEKAELLAADAVKFFTEPHYNGHPSVLVRLGAVPAGELAELITDAWRCQAPRAAVKAFDASA